MKVVLFYLITLIIVIYCLILTTKEYIPEGIYHNKGYNDSKDTLGILLDRIEWANNYNGRLNTIPRFLLTSIILIIVLNTVVLEKTFQPIIFFQSVFVSFIIIRSLYVYTLFHCDKHSNYAIYTNIKMLRKKLNVKKGKKLVENKNTFSCDSECRNYTYNTDI